MDALSPVTPLEGDVEMFSRGQMRSVFSIDTKLADRRSHLSIVPEVETPKTTKFLDVLRYRRHSDNARPISEITEIWDDYDDDVDEEEEDISDHSSIEEDGLSEISEFEEYSEGLSFESNEGRRSQSTLSSFEEVPTPLSVRRVHFIQNLDDRKSVEGPRGPHLFRSSYASDDYALQLSPLLPRHQDLKIDTFTSDASPITAITETSAVVVAAIQEWNAMPSRNSETDTPRTWTASEVSFWMARSGIDSATVEQFEFHDISGAVLMDLQFQDLKELGIVSFGKRHEVWNKICSLREGDGRISPVPTPFEDVSQRNSRGSNTSSRNNLCHEDATPITPGAGRRRRRKYRQNGNEPITPADSVSIVAIEQLIPKPHRCEKGENCSKWKKQQRLLRRIHDEHGLPISPGKGGHIFMSGDPGNAFKAPKIVNHVRPASEAEPSVVGPSVVASSDLLGPGEMPYIALHESRLSQIETRDAQENVKQFLNFQHFEPPQMLMPPLSPVDGISQEPLEMFPQLKPPTSTQAPLATLQALPRLQIPRASTANGYIEHFTANRSAVETVTDPFAAFSPYHSAVATPGGVQRFGTPASEMDVPVTAVSLGPVSRDTSQSVPPNMHYREPVERRSSRQDWRRPSFQLPSLNEDEVFSPAGDSNSSRRSSNTLEADRTSTKGSVRSSAESNRNVDSRYAGVTHAGWMKKRKTKMLRHEWNDAHFRLAGNNLAMHKNDIPQSAVLESLNIDQYAVGCSSIASNKLSSKLKALKIANGKEKAALNDAAFEFQLVPDQLFKGKTHHFAVKSKDERIDWMRELMVAKALKAKREGFDVELNGTEL